MAAWLSITRQLNMKPVSAGAQGGPPQTCKTSQAVFGVSKGFYIIYLAKEARRVFFAMCYRPLQTTDKNQCPCVCVCVCVKLIWASSLILFLNNNVLIWESRTHGFQVFKMGMSCYSFPVPTHNGTDIWGSFMFCSHPTGNTVSPSHLQCCIFYPSATLYLLATHDTVSPSHLQHCIFCPSATLTLLHCIFCSPHSQGCFPEKQSVQYVFYHCPMANRHLAHY